VELSTKFGICMSYIWKIELNGKSSHPNKTSQVNPPGYNPYIYSTMHYTQLGNNNNERNRVEMMGI
jgi:hypothetical protein